MRFSVLRKMLPKSQGAIYMEDKITPMDQRGGSAEISKKLSSQNFRWIEKSCDWSVTNHEKIVF
jgi:hypothetical protein